ncbi:MAG: alanine racemase [Candidatus Omnitrophota bacterium]
MTVENYRPTWAEIDLKAIHHNYHTIKRLVSKDEKVMVIVKADAYGHGSVEISRMLERENADYLGVATLEEAITLRKAGIKTPVLVLGSVFPHEVDAAAEHGVTLTLCNNELLRYIERKGTNIRVHVDVDTGMGRIGVWHEEAVDFVAAVKRVPNIEIEGLYTHFSVAARDKFFTQYQIDSFMNVIASLEAMGIDIPLRHAANSIAVVDWKNAHFNMIRPGLIIYGMYPKKTFRKVLKLKPAFQLKTKISFIKTVSAGRSISYGRTFIAQAETRIATLPIGYADGYGRILSAKAQVLIHGHLFPVVGKVTMDQTMVDVGTRADIKVGDEVVLIGKQGFGEITVEDLSRMAGTIPYEIVTGVTSRVPRVYTY